VKRRFDATVAIILDEADGLREDALKAATRAVETARFEIRNDLADQELSGRSLVGVKRRVGQHVDRLAATLHRQARTDLRKAWNLGVEMVEEPAKAAGLAIAPLGHVTEAEPPALTRGWSPAQLLAVLQEYSAELITGLGSEARRRINGILHRAALGQLTTSEAIGQIAAALPSPSVFRTLEARAQAIFRTEVGRVFAASSDLRLRQMAGRLPGLEKKWVAVMDDRTRPTHRVANDQIVGALEDFIVGGEHAAFPRDPRLTAQESVNCRCWAVPHLPTDVLASLGVPVGA
jgi:hypothetical protein